MRRIVGVAIGIGLCFPGALALQTVSSEFGVYQDMSLTEALLMIIIVLACALLFGQGKARLTAEELEKQAREMELASRRIEEAQRRNRSTRRRVAPAPAGRGSRTSSKRRPM